MQPALPELLAVEALRRLAGQRSFEPGEEYAKIGAVRTLQGDGMSVRAGMQGAERYRVRPEAAPAGAAERLQAPADRPIH